MTWYLRAAGRLETDPADGDEGADQYVYDPDDPCPTLGGQLVLPEQYRTGPVDQAPILERPDILSYTSGVLRESIAVVGPVSVVLHAATSARDTDWVAKLC